MTHGGAITFLLTVFLTTEANSYVLPTGKYTPSRKYLKSESNPVQVFYSGMIPIEHTPFSDFTENNVVFADFEDTGIRQGQTRSMSAAKRGQGDIYTVSKRIHTCAFMRRLGLPIGLCFKGQRNKQKPKEPEQEVRPDQDAYEYLARLWPVHSMLGGGVGR